MTAKRWPPVVTAICLLGIVALGLVIAWADDSKLTESKPAEAADQTSTPKQSDESTLSVEQAR